MPYLKRRTVCQLEVVVDTDCSRHDLHATEASLSILRSRGKIDIF